MLTTEEQARIFAKAKAITHIYNTAKPYLMAGHRMVAKLEPVWAADTQRRLLAMGLVPTSLIESISTASQGATQ